MVQVPRAMDVNGEYIVLASEPLEITVLRVSLTGELTPAGTASAAFQLVRQLSIVSPGHPLQVRSSTKQLLLCSGLQRGPEQSCALPTRPTPVPASLACTRSHSQWQAAL